MTFLDVLKWVGTVLFSIAGGGTLVMSLSGWLGKVWAERLMEKERSEHAKALETERARYAKELEQDRARYSRELEALKSSFEQTHRRLQNELDKTIFGHQLKTQTEFNALMELWKKVPPLESALALVRPMYVWGLLGEILGGRYHTERREQLGHAVEDLDSIISSFGPFVDARIYDDVQELVRIARSELTAILGSNKEDWSQQSWQDTGRNTLAEFRKVRERLFKTINKRIGELSEYSADRGTNGAD